MASDVVLCAISPECAGMTRRARPRRRPRKSPARVRGDDPASTVATPSTEESRPRARGSTGIVARRRGQDRVPPTHAGMIPSRPSGSRRTPCPAHVRGDDPCGPRPTPLTLPSRPRARGCPSGGQPDGPSRTSRHACGGHATRDPSRPVGKRQTVRRGHGFPSHGSTTVASTTLGPRSLALYVVSSTGRDAVVDAMPGVASLRLDVAPSSDAGVIRERARARLSPLPPGA